MKNTILFCSLLSAFSFSAISQSNFDYSFIDPHNEECQLIPQDRSLGVKYSSSTSKSKKVFMDTIALVQKGMNPVIRASGLDLTWNIDWNSKVENASASASRSSKKRVLNIYGQLFRNPNITPDGFAFVLCHELGHILAGAPFYGNSNVMSAEGQADYYATNVCLPLVYQGQINIEAIKRLNIPIRTKNRCDSKWRSKEESAICQRAIMSGLSVFTWISKISNEQMDLSSRHRTRAEETNAEDYPELQCRLDTAIAGALCNKGPTSTSRIGAPSNCSARQFIKRDGARPECWFIK